MVKLFKSHVTQLQNVTRKLAYNLTMNGTQIILGRHNNNKKTEAEQLIYRAIRILESIE